jgi:thiol-disulfide isomerase/thioredoxin
VTYVVVALVVTNVLTLLNLLLLFGVIRRLRVQQFPPPGGMAAPGSLPVGTPIDAFVTTDTDGLPLRRDELPAGAVIGFFSPGCTPCEALIPKFVAYAEGLSDGRKSALAVVVGSREEAADYVARLSPAARVVVESQEGDLVRAFQVTGYPTLFQLDGDGRLLVSDASSVERLAVPAA